MKNQLLALTLLVGATTAVAHYNKETKEHYYNNPNREARHERHMKEGHRHGHMHRHGNKSESKTTMKKKDGKMMRSSKKSSSSK